MKVGKSKEVVENVKKNSRKRAVAWIFLFVLVGMFVSLNYIKFFGAPNKNIEEYPAESSTERAIQIALEDIVKNFNNSKELNDYLEQNIKMKATLNQHSIFISYISDNTVTYEFSYSNLNLDIKVSNSPDNIERFNKVYGLLLKAIQKRINNDASGVDDMINNIVNDVKTYDGVLIEKNDKTNYYSVNITKRLTESEDNIEDNVTDNETGNVNDNLEDDI